MKIFFNVKNFGKIDNARIDISNFVVFVGNNNSGKTQLMELIYGVLQRVANMYPEISNQNFTNGNMSIRQADILEILSNINQCLQRDKNLIIEDIFHQSIPLDEMFLEFDEIDKWYEIKEVTAENCQEVLSQTTFNKELKVKILKDISEKKYVFWAERDAGENKILHTGMISIFYGTFDDMAISIVVEVIIQRIMGLYSASGKNMLFLPASRMGLLLLYRYYFSERSEEYQRVSPERETVDSGIVKPVSDFLSFLLKYSYNETKANKYRDIIGFINENIIEGTLNEVGEVTTYIPRDQNVELPLYLSSSMINEIDPIMKMLTDSTRYRYLFYDEVETSLHPSKQIEIVKLLNRLNNAGLRMIISTHSDTMATKINNLLLLSQQDLDMESKEKLLRENGLNVCEKDLLKSSDFHVYQFVNEKGKSTVQELEFRKLPYTGYDFSLFEDSAAGLYEESKIALGMK